MLYKEFYSELGKLLYAVANIDGVITQAEKKKLHEIVKNELIPADIHKDEFRTGAAYYTEIEFDYLDEKIIDTETAFNSFIDFIEDHRTAINPKMQKICLLVTGELADAYRKTNKKEKALLEQLTKKIKSINVKISEA